MKIAIHMLTPYPPSNPNRDELGAPKTAVVGGVLRQRISSQALKRAWRLSDCMAELEDSMSTRTRTLGVEIRDRMIKGGAKEAAATKTAKAILLKFANKEDSKRPLCTPEVVIFGHEEWEAAHQLADLCAKEARQPTDEELDLLTRDTTSVDVAMFGRMRAAEPKWNVDAAIAVSHALTTNQIAIEADFWTAVDDLNVREDEAGAGGMGEREYASGVYYVYANVDHEGLTKNLGGDGELATRSVLSLIRAMATTTPGGHRTSFAHQTYAAYLRADVGRSVTGNLMLPAFERPVIGTEEAIQLLRDAAGAQIKAYGLDPAVAELSVPDQLGSMSEFESALSTALS